jgi:hypothetical protein
VVHRIPGGDIDGANALLSHGANSIADLMVMNGSRLREFLLGGFTRSIFQSMTVQVLLGLEADLVATCVGRKGPLRTLRRARRALSVLPRSLFLS